MNHDPQTSALMITKELCRNYMRHFSEPTNDFIICRWYERCLQNNGLHYTQSDRTESIREIFHSYAVDASLIKRYE